MNDVHPTWGTPPLLQPKYRTLDIVVMWVCGIIGGCALLGLLLGVFFVVVVKVAPESPMSGVGFLAGLGLAALCAVVTAIVLPGAAPPGWRVRAYGISAAIFGVGALLSFVALTVLW